MLTQLFSPIIELFVNAGIAIANFFSTLAESVETFLSGYGFLPDFWNVLPSQITGFILASIVVGVSVTVITAILRNV